MTTTPHGLHIRPARREDVAAIVGLLALDDIGRAVDTADPEALPLYMKQFDAIAQSPNETLYVACLGNVVVGTFELLIAHSLPYRAATRCILEAAQVRPDMRGRKIGETMVRFALEEATRLGADLITLSSNAKRSDAHRFYERLGFEKSHVGFKMNLRT